MTHKGAPVLLPLNKPLRNTGSSASTLGVLSSEVPGALRASCSLIKSRSILSPAGNPSSTMPIASPCDSPNMVSFKFSPNVFIRLPFAVV